MNSLSCNKNKKANWSVSFVYLFHCTKSLHKMC